MRMEKIKRPRNVKGVLCWILDGLCILSGAFFLGIYIPYFFWHLFQGHWADILASVLVFIGVLVPFFGRKFFKRLLKKVYLPLKIFWCCAMCFYMVTFSVFCIVIGNHSDVPHKENDRQQVVMVFGCKIHRDSSPSSELRSRLDRTVELLKEYPEAICVVSGGKGDDEPMAEGEAMSDYLISKGVSVDRIFRETKSTDTVENLKFSLELLEERGYKKEDCSLICVSSSFHTPRIFLLCNRFGVEDCATVSAPSPNKFLEFTYTIREYMSYVYLLLFGA